MDQQKSYKRVTAIVPAYNEETRIGKVLEVLSQCDFLEEVIVVDDGSTDKTGLAAQRFPVKYIAMKKNSGKGKAMETGVQKAKGDIIFFCDADVRGLTPQIVKDIVTPVVKNEVEMCIGMRNRKSYALRVVLAFVPLVGGERALTKELWNMVPAYYKERFRIEAGLNFYAKYYGKGFRFQVFKHLTQTIKEKKYGIVAGLRARVGMFRDYFQAFLKLQFTKIPKSVVNRRLFFLSYFFSVFTCVIGFGVAVAMWYGPRRFVADFLGEEFLNHSGISFFHNFLLAANQGSTGIVIFFAALMFFLNLFVIITNVKQLIWFLTQYYEKWKISFLSPHQLKKKEIIGDKKM